MGVFVWVCLCGCVCVGVFVWVCLCGYVCVGVFVWVCLCRCVDMWVSDRGREVAFVT